MSWPQRGLFRSRPLAQALGLYLPTTALTRVIGLGRSILLTWLMPPAQYGLFMLGLHVANVIMPICGLSAHEGLARFVPAYETRGKLRGYLRRVLPIVVVLPVCGGGGLMLLAPWLGGPMLGTASAGGLVEGVSGGTLTALARWVGLIALLLALYFAMMSVLRGTKLNSF